MRDDSQSYDERIPDTMCLRRWFSISVFFLSSFLVLGGMCLAYTPKEILRLSDEARGNLEGVEWQVAIRSVEGGETQDRDLEVQAKGYDFLAKFGSPAKVKGQKILFVDHNMWFTKPNVKKPVPISPRQKLVGGAAYGDIAATNYSDDYEASPLPDETLNDESCYVFDLRASTKKATYDRIKYWVSKARVVGLKAEYYTVSDKMFKTALFEYAHQAKIGNNVRPFISKMTIKDALIEKNITILEFHPPILKEIPPSTFDLNLLMMR